MANNLSPVQDAVRQLKELKQTYGTIPKYKELKNHSEVIVGLFGSDRLKEQFQRLTTFYAHTDDSFRLKNILMAIDVAVRELELSEATKAYSETASKMNQQEGKLSFPRISNYVLFTFFLIAVIAIISNPALLNNMVFSGYVVALMAAVPIVLTFNFFSVKFNDRTFQIILGIILIILTIIGTNLNLK
ncbi:MAG: hypothetical protein DI539_23790 [Flavobacterium psychrophilum]|nr:MAG: hypothetical protein DI539_23790 [Flavobacterium psychrophilum]